jgi:DNA polymerase theta
MLLSKLVASQASAAIQIVAMSATMSGLDSLSDWLGANLFLTNFRPVPLTEHAVFEGTVFAKASLQQLQQAGTCAKEVACSAVCVP